jgi:hypothetical protein
MALFPKEKMYTSYNRPQLFTWCIESQSDKEHFFSLNREDGFRGTRSLRKLFVDLTIEDPTEATFADTVFGDLPYWLSVRDDAFLKNYIKEWRKEADVRRKALAFKAIVKEVKTGSRSAFTAAKFLIDEPWLSGNTVAEKKAIAKSKQETTAEAAEVSKAVEDFKRLTNKG